MENKTNEEVKELSETQENLEETKIVPVKDIQPKEEETSTDKEDTLKEKTKSENSDENTEKETRIKKRKKKNKRIRAAIYWTAVIGVVSSGIYVGAQTLEYYKSKEGWKKLSGTPLASLDPYMLYLKPEEKENLERYLKLYSEYWNEDVKEFTPQANKNNMNNLFSIYEGLPDALKTHLEERNTQISTLWTIKAEYDSFFYKDEILASVTPQKIQEFVNNYWGKLTTYLDNNNSNYFEGIYNKFMSLSDDTTNVSILVEIFNSIYNVTEKGLEVKPDLQSEALTNWNTYRRRLKNNWMFVTSKLDPLIRTAREKLGQHDEHLKKYNDVLRAQQAKQTYDQFVTDFNNYKNNLIELPDFRNKNKEEVQRWGNENGIIIKITEGWTESDDNKDKVMSQSPRTPYTKILKGATLEIQVSKGDRKKEEERLKAEQKQREEEERKREEERKSQEERNRDVINEVRDRVRDTLNNIRNNTTDGGNNN